MKKALIMFTLVFLISSLLITFAACAPAPRAEETVKIVYLASITGPMAEKVKHTTNGVELAVAEINDAGGILGGRQVEMITYDTKSISEESVSAARKAIYDDKVKAVVGIEEAGLALPTMPIVLKAEIHL